MTTARGNVHKQSGQEKRATTVIENISNEERIKTTENVDNVDRENVNMKRKPYPYVGISYVRSPFGAGPVPTAIVLQSNNRAAIKK